MRNTFQITFLTFFLLQHTAQENGGEGQMPDKVLNTMLKHGGTQKPFSYVPTGMDLKKFKEKARQYVFIFQSAWWLNACADPEGRTGGPDPPWKITKI